MILSDSALKQAIKSNQLVIEPLSDDTIQQNGVDLKINNELGISIPEGKTGVVDSTSSEEIRKFYEILESDNGYFILSPLSHYLLVTQEHLRLPSNLMGFCGLRSTFARLGFVSPLTIVDAGFEGTLTIGVFYGGGVPIKIPVGCRFLHLVFARLVAESKEPYKGHYTNQKGVSLPKALV
jgi:dCTP deaminase